MLDRRQILLGVSALMGTSILPSTALALEKSLHEGVEDKKAVLSPLQYKAVSIIADIIIPRTETASASEAGAVAFVDHALAAWLLESESNVFIAALNAFLSAYPGFVTAPQERQMALIAATDKQLADLPSDRRFYRQLKELVLVGYYTSEAGAAEELAYDPVPGGYTIIPVTSETKAWST